ncbi:Hypothetical predicted protein [Cloeon dipterum]|uniref:Uncharacterized protein n=1 Tax=Cloeon dipterum TaxID=197152 RepID=A0A8S1E1Q7_9INSE|nr:Hypothetical predicted protein [Cloeon dipterum]
MLWQRFLHQSEIKLVPCKKKDCKYHLRDTGSFGAGTMFAVGATRLGKLDRPAWCFSEAEFKLAVEVDKLSNDTLETNYAIALSFTPPYTMQAVETINAGICEPID